MSDETRPDNLGDEDVRPKRTLTDFERGFIEGLSAYAYMQDGVLYVGTTGRTLRQAMRSYLDEVSA